MKKKLRPLDLVFAALLGFSVLVVLFRIRYGFSLTNDESFYLALPWRLLQGDALITDEWNLAQLSSFLLLPAVWVYRLICPSGDGILLAMRWVYVAGHALTSVFLYIRLRKGGFRWSAVAGAVLHFLFIPFNLQAWSYHSMAVDLLASAGVWAATMPQEKPRRLSWMAVGLLFAGAVLCCPYLVIVYLLYALCVLLRRVLKQTEGTLALPVFRGSSFGFFTLGCGLLAAGFLAFLLSRLSFDTLAQCLSGIFADAGHAATGLLDGLFEYVKDISSACAQLNFEYMLVFWLWVMVMAVLIADPDHRKHRVPAVAVCTLLGICAMIIFGKDLDSGYQAVILPVVFAGLPAYLLTQEKPKGLWACLFVPGFLYSVADSFASDNHFLVIVMALSLASLASLPMLERFLDELKEDAAGDEEQLSERRGLAALTAVLLLAQGGCRAWSMVTVCFQDADSFACNTLLADGPAKGIYTQPSYANFYNDRWADLMTVRAQGEGNLCVLSYDCWDYIALSEDRCASFSAWFPDSDLTRIRLWWSLHPDTQPDYILIPIREGTLYGEYDLTHLSDETVAELLSMDGYTLTEGRAYHILIRNK